MTILCVLNSPDISDALSSIQILEKKTKRVIIFPIVFAAIGAITNMASAAAIGYFSNNAVLDDMARVSGKSGQIRAALNPAMKVAKAVSSSLLIMKDIAMNSSLVDTTSKPKATL